MCARTGRCLIVRRWFGEEGDDGVPAVRDCDFSLFQLRKFRRDL